MAPPRGFRKIRSSLGGLFEVLCWCLAFYKEAPSTSPLGDPSEAKMQDPFCCVRKVLGRFAFQENRSY